MDPVDSVFLNLLSPSLNELDVDWCHADDPDSYSSQVPTLGWLNDVVVTKGDEEEEEEQPAASSAAATLVTSATFVHKASEYSSVLKLSDIALALQRFSRAGGVSHALETSPTQSLSSNPPSPHLEASRGTGSAGFNPQMMIMPRHGSTCQQGQKVPREALGVKDLGLMCMVNSYEEDVDSDDGLDHDSDQEEDVKPFVSQVRIIRRPNSSCGQLMSPVAKRMKMSGVKEESVTFGDMDGKEGLKKMRREGMSQREVHILSERQRRKSMRESFTILQSLVPKLKLKHTDRITVLTEVISYIHSLRGTIDELDRKKADIMDFLGMSQHQVRSRHQPDRDEKVAKVTYIKTGNNSTSDDMGEKSGGWCNMNGQLVAMVEVTVRMCATDVFVTLNTPRQKGVWSRVLSLLQRYSIEVLNATLASSGDSTFHCIHGKVSSMESVEGVDLQDKVESVIVKQLRRRRSKRPQFYGQIL